MGRLNAKHEHYMAVWICMASNLNQANAAKSQSERCDSNSEHALLVYLLWQFESSVRSLNFSRNTDHHIAPRAKTAWGELCKFRAVETAYLILWTQSLGDEGQAMMHCGPLPGNEALLDDALSWWAQIGAGAPVHCSSDSEIENIWGLARFKSDEWSLQTRSWRAELTSSDSGLTS